MTGIDLTPLVKAAKSIQKPVSLATVMLLVLYLIFSQIVEKMQNIDQSVLPTIVNWIGVIALLSVVLSIGSYSLPMLLKGRAGDLVIGEPKIRKPKSPKTPRAGG